jgi:hypothetical protein
VIESAGQPSARGARDTCRGFSLRSGCWGYRDIFRQSIEGLFAEGMLGGHRAEVTAAVFALLERADRACYDHVLQEFLGALNPRTHWLMDIPGYSPTWSTWGARSEI